ncbi:GNAT family N-acetyltransferase [Jeotgalibacillus malaysiensis]|uniref:GNAT family N-acetyltransferase n=1 Tax=Jeotgalibacillus malaysiensis TaxID=1508404 RepID=UPI00384B657D
METARTILEKVTESDLEDVKRLYKDPLVRKYLGGVREEVAVSAVGKDFFQSDETSLYLTVGERDTSAFIGLVSLDPHHDGEDIEISYQLMPEWWGRGLGSEVVEAVLNTAFNEMNLTKIVAETQTANHSSCRLLEKVGMTLDRKVVRFGEEQRVYVIQV